METYLLLQAPGDLRVQAEEFSRLRQQLPGLVLPPVRVEEVVVTGDRARVTLRAPTLVSRGHRTCELVEYDGARAIVAPSQGALVPRPMGAYALYCWQVEVWDWVEARRAEA
jgi:hypothetical protein